METSTSSVADSVSVTGAVRCKLPFPSGTGDKVAVLKVQAPLKSPQEFRTAITPWAGEKGSDAPKANASRVREHDPATRR
jgi:hypothetical protein